MSAIKNLGGLIPFNATSDESGYTNAVPVRLNVSPFIGGRGREAILNVSAAPGGTAVVKVQGHPSLDSSAPSNTDEDWADIVTLTATSPRLRQEIELPSWIRVIVETAGTGTAYFTLEETT